jgi:hypothetical protein
MGIIRILILKVSRGDEKVALYIIDDISDLTAWN